MPIAITHGFPTLFMRKDSFERLGLTRAMFDAQFALTPEDFSVEGDIIAIGPLPNDDVLVPLIEALERAGAEYFEDFFELTGNWPEWLRLLAMPRRA